MGVEGVRGATAVDIVVDSEEDAKHDELAARRVKGASGVTCRIATLASASCSAQACARPLLSSACYRSLSPVFAPALLRFWLDPAPERKCPRPPIGCSRALAPFASRCSLLLDSPLACLGQPSTRPRHVCLPCSVRCSRCSAPCPLLPLTVLCSSPAALSSPPAAARPHSAPAASPAPFASPCSPSRRRWRGPCITIWIPKCTYTE